MPDDRVCALPGHQGCNPYECRWAPPDEPAEPHGPARGGWAQTYRELGYGWCRPCQEWHRPPECWIDPDGRPQLDLPWTDQQLEGNVPESTASVYISIGPWGPQS